ncbi:hypothetical protein K7432_013621 [Basidiobolus ranarum]|uniref:Transmembrane protein n=1 Tax=Basidiobolus ranarum TaxID=34480 RepID=A0ABR2VQL1_9FUNG
MTRKFLLLLIVMAFSVMIFRLSIVTVFLLGILILIYCRTLNKSRTTFPAEEQGQCSPQSYREADPTMEELPPSYYSPSAPIPAYLHMEYPTMEESTSLPPYNADGDVSPSSVASGVTRQTPPTITTPSETVVTIPPPSYSNN